MKPSSASSVGAALLLGWLAACATELSPAPTCREGTAQLGSRCVPIGAQPGRDEGREIPSMTIADRPADAGIAPGVALPFLVDAHYAMTGYVGSGEVQTSRCTDPGTVAGAHCRRITWTPAGSERVGFYFQHPDNNWRDRPGLRIAPGARTVRLRAWGERGGESLRFSAGLMAADGFEVETAPITLGTTPAEVVIDISGVDYARGVVGALAWFAENPSGTSSVTFYLDNLEWSDVAVGESASGVALPFWVDDHYRMTGYVGMGAVETEPCATDPGSPDAPCRRITWTPNGGSFAGFFFQHPENNWGEQPGLRIQPGARRVTFTAWGATGTESLNFAAGLRPADGFQIETGYGVVGTTPTPFSIDLTGVQYSDVAGAFGWFVDSPRDASTVSFFIDDIRWE
jgi:hypothetical protein